VFFGEDLELDVETMQRCPECGTAWVDGITCQDHFHQMGFWEMENPAFAREVHHLMVVSYYLQHPSLYSPEGLSGAKQLLVDFLERGISPQRVRERDRDKVDSGKRNYKIKGTAASHGEYPHPIRWTMTAADVTAFGLNHYVESVRLWAQSLLNDLKTSGNL